MGMYDPKVPGLLYRLKIAWKVLQWKNFELQYTGFRRVCYIRKDITADCDNKDRTGCTNHAVEALGYDTVNFNTQVEDWYHLCPECANNAIGTLGS